MLRTSALVCTLFLCSAVAAGAQDYVYDPTSTDFDPDYLSTYSIIVRDPGTGELGIGVASRVLAVGRNGSSFRGGVGVIVHQMSSNPFYGRIGMEMLMAGLHPQEIMSQLVRSDEASARRQVAILDFQGRSAAFTGGGPVGLDVYAHPRDDPQEAWKGHRCGIDYCAQANSMMGSGVVDGMAESFESTGGKPLADRILDALDAAQAAGGDRRGQQSAALFIVQLRGGAANYSDVAEDLRVNDHPTPLIELRRLLTVRRSRGVIAAANQVFEAGDRERGLQMLIELRDKIPGKDNVWIALGSSYLKLGRRADALDAIRRAVEINPYNARRGSGGLPQNPSFEALLSDREWIRIMDRPELSSSAPDAVSQTERTRVRVETGLGAFELELDDARAPGTVANFLRYVEAGRYDGGRFHRTVTLDNQVRDDILIEVIQAGANADGDSGLEPISLERTRDTGLRHLDGTISMARGAPDSATGDFFICIGAQPSLDFGGMRNNDGQGFAAFGQVASGMDVVRRIHRAPANDDESLQPPIIIERIHTVR